jgi:hypothetical protein
MTHALSEINFYHLYAGSSAYRPFTTLRESANPAHSGQIHLGRSFFTTKKP